MGPEYASLLQQCNIDPTLRAQQLPLETWVDLALKYQQMKGTVEPNQRTNNKTTESRKDRRESERKSNSNSKSDSTTKESELDAKRKKQERERELLLKEAIARVARKNESKNKNKNKRGKSEEM